MQLKIPSFQLPSISETREHGGKVLRSTLSEKILIAPQFHYAASNLTRVFRLNFPDAPGLVFVGGEFVSNTFDGADIAPDFVSCTGSGLEIENALAACLGESVEHVAQCIRPDDKQIVGASNDVPHGLSPDNVAELLVLAGFGSDQGIRSVSWVSARRLSDDASVLVPTDLCYRNSAGQRLRSPRSKLSTGTACGATPEAATLTALLELVERDAVALWWKGGQRGRAVAPQRLARSGTDGLMSQLRCGVATRKSWLLDITTDIGIPTFAAVSADVDGKCVAIGAAARLCEADAIHKSIIELCQAEIGELLLYLKLSERLLEGKTLDDQTNTFRSALRRSQSLDANTCELLRPISSDTQANQFGPPVSDLQEAVRRLIAHDFDVFSVDLTRSDLCMPVVRVIVPGLQLYPSRHVTTRLDAMIARTKDQQLIKQEFELM